MAFNYPAGCFFVLRGILESEAEIMKIPGEHRGICCLLGKGNGFTDEDVGKCFFVALCLL